MIQATSYENLEFHKRYNYFSYLIKEIDVGGGSNFDIADKITVSNFRQQMSGEHKGEEIEAKPEVAIKKPKPASIEEQLKRALSEIIAELKALYDKSYEPNSTTKTAQQIKDLLLNSPSLHARLEKSAKINSYDDFRFTYDDCVQEALVQGFDQNVDFYTLLLNDENVREKISSVFMREIYQILRGESITVADIHRPVTYSEPEPVVLKVAESPLKYGETENDQ